MFSLIINPHLLYATHIYSNNNIVDVNLTICCAHARQQRNSHHYTSEFQNCITTNFRCSFVRARIPSRHCYRHTLQRARAAMCIMATVWWQRPMTTTRQLWLQKAYTLSKRPHLCMHSTLFHLCMQKDLPAARRLI